MTSTDYEKALLELFTDAAGTGLVVDSGDAAAAGIPSSYIANVVHRSAQIITAEDAATEAKSLAESIAEAPGATNSTDPAELARSVPRI